MKMGLQLQWTHSIGTYHQSYPSLRSPRLSLHAHSTGYFISLKGGAVFRSPRSHLLAISFHLLLYILFVCSSCCSSSFIICYIIIGFSVNMWTMREYNFCVLCIMCDRVFYNSYSSFFEEVGHCTKTVLCLCWNLGQVLSTVLMDIFID